MLGNQVKPQLETVLSPLQVFLFLMLTREAARRAHLSRELLLFLEQRVGGATTLGRLGWFVAKGVVGARKKSAVCVLHFNFQLQLKI